MTVPAIKVDGLREVARELRKIGDTDTPNAIKEANRDAARIVAAEAASRFPSRTGKLAGTVRGTGSKRTGDVRVGSARVPYAGPVEFGGYPGTRPFVKSGRYLGPAVEAKEPAVFVIYERALQDALRKVDL